MFDYYRAPRTLLQKIVNWKIVTPALAVLLASTVAASFIRKPSNSTELSDIAATSDPASIEITTQPIFPEPIPNPEPSSIPPLEQTVSVPIQQQLSIKPRIPESISIPEPTSIPLPKYTSQITKTTLSNSSSVQNPIFNTYKKPVWITVEATAYCPCDKCCGPSPVEDRRQRKTAHGRKAYLAGVAGAPSMPAGSRLDIPEKYYSRGNKGSWIPIDDRGDEITDANEWHPTDIDLRFKLGEHDKAVKFGRQHIKVRYFEKITPAKYGTIR